MQQQQQQQQHRKTRFVCISDTHHQTPKLPRGDVLIHAGDLTNQGSLGELQRTVAWMERADFEARIVIAGNHDITLDEPFFAAHATKWKWPTTPPRPETCRNLLVQSPSITYLEHEAVTMYLTGAQGPQTCFKVFGSPYSPGKGDWAFQYADDAAAAERLWSRVEDDNDIVVTHTPARGHCDQTARDGVHGCPALKQRLASVRPMLHVCGHIHDGRGVERIRWRPAASTSASASTSSYVDGIEPWQDPGVGNKKLSLLDLTARSRCRLDNSARMADDAGRGLVARHRHLVASAAAAAAAADPGRLGECWYQNVGDGNARCRRTAGGAIECRCGGTGGPMSQAQAVGVVQRKETAVINAAILGLRNAREAMTFNKPIVVDMELPTWQKST